ncbi:NUDIX domain-containing protein [Rhodosalinus sediminis]|uniref:NUDIX domain-containing protein n=1 Tax=Rhodosalinus sediminis TaxID=1940533 RepID=UPI00235758E6|nr:NUDIX domain-containing protein [Rhodosalinus sediminis]
MAQVFLYGTLRHAPLLERVLGGRPAAVRPARLDGHAVRAVADGAYPALVAEAGGVAEGEVIALDDPAGWERLRHYEAVFGYAPQPCTVETPEGAVAAQVFRPDTPPATEGAWSLDAWAGRWAAQSLEAAAEVMGQMGRMSPRALAAIHPMIRARAHSRVLAAAPRPRAPVLAPMSRDDVELSAHRRPYADYYSYDEQDLRFPRFGGGLSEPVTRAALVATDAALVLPYDPRRDEVLLLEQFRPGPYMRGDLRPWCLEPVAGRVDPGEDPETTARRETEEEAGLTLERLELISRSYPSPGCLTEFFHIYLGRVDLARRPAETGGLEAEAEDIRRHVLPFDTVLGWADAGQIDVAPLALAIYWLARHRSRLRDAG